MAGLYRPDGGEIWFDGTRIDGLPPYEIVHLGLTKTWQIPHELRNLTVLENLVLAAKNNSGERLLNLFFRPGQVKRSEEHTSELQSRLHLVCRLLLEKKKT